MATHLKDKGHIWRGEGRECNKCAGKEDWDVARVHCQKVSTECYSKGEYNLLGGACECTCKGCRRRRRETAPATEHCEKVAMGCWGEMFCECDCQACVRAEFGGGVRHVQRVKGTEPPPVREVWGEGRLEL